MAQSTKFHRIGRRPCRDCGSLSAAIRPHTRRVGTGRQRSAPGRCVCAGMERPVIRRRAWQSDVALPSAYAHAARANVGDGRVASRFKLHGRGVLVGGDGGPDLLRQRRCRTDFVAGPGVRSNDGLATGPGLDADRQSVDSTDCDVSRDGGPRSVSDLSRDLAPWIFGMGRSVICRLHCGGVSAGLGGGGKSKARRFVACLAAALATGDDGRTDRKLPTGQRVGDLPPRPSLGTSGSAMVWLFLPTSALSCF